MKALKQAAIDHLWMAGARADTLAVAGGPLVIERGEGVFLYDVEGRRYFDCIGSLETCHIGHGRAEVRDAIYTQLESLDFADVFRVTTPATIRLAERIAALAPGDLSRVHFVSGGSEAVEAALKFARQYHRLNGEAGRYKVVSRRGAYHGCTYGAMAVDGGYYRTRVQDFHPLPSFGRFVRSATSAREIDELIRSEGPATVSAVILDPAATSIGVSIPPPDYLPAVREICDRHGVLLIADEVITGFGRTGRTFACDHYDVVPDIMTVSKGLSSGYFPIGAMVASERLASLFVEEEGRFFSNGHTFGGHPVGCAAALANLEVIEREGLVDRAAETGLYLLERLRDLEHHRSHRATRGLGLLCGLELGPEGDAGVAFTRRVIHQGREHGLLTFAVHPGNVLFFCPPLIIRREEIDEMVAALSRTLSEVESGG